MNIQDLNNMTLSSAATHIAAVQRQPGDTSTAKNADKTRYSDPAKASGSFADYYARSLQKKDEEEKPAAAKQKTASEKAAETAAEHKALATELSDYLKKSPAQHLRESVMKEMNITEEELAQMPPAKRQAMEKEINERIRERLAATEKNHGKPGELEQGGPHDPKITALDFGTGSRDTAQSTSGNFFTSLFPSMQTGQMQK